MEHCVNLFQISAKVKLISAPKLVELCLFLLLVECYKATKLEPVCSPSLNILIKVSPCPSLKKAPINKQSLLEMFSSCPANFVGTQHRAWELLLATQYFMHYHVKIFKNALINGFCHICYKAITDN